MVSHASEQLLKEIQLKIVTKYTSPIRLARLKKEQSFLTLVTVCRTINSNPADSGDR